MCTSSTHIHCTTGLWSFENIYSLKGLWVSWFKDIYHSVSLDLYPQSWPYISTKPGEIAFTLMYVCHKRLEWDQDLQDDIEISSNKALNMYAPRVCSKLFISYLLARAKGLAGRMIKPFPLYISGMFTKSIIVPRYYSCGY